MLVVGRRKCQRRPPVERGASEVCIPSNGFGAPRLPPYRYLSLAKNTQQEFGNRPGWLLTVALIRRAAVQLVEPGKAGGRHSLGGFWFSHPQAGGSVMKYGLFAIASVVVLAGVSDAGEFLPAVDLTGFQPLQAELADTSLPIQTVGCSTVPCRRFYITGLWGPSFANLNVPDRTSRNTSATIFTAGIAAGISLERERGRLRMEVEGLGRDYYSAAVDATPGIREVIVNNWSVTGNIWRDFMFTERLGCYGGGGIGGGGYRFGASSPTSTTYGDLAGAFAWQAGGGLIFELNDQITFDVSYRYYSLGDIKPTATSLATEFSASQVLFALRVFEPFRALRR